MMLNNIKEGPRSKFSQNTGYPQAHFGSAANFQTKHGDIVRQVSFYLFI